MINLVQDCDGADLKSGTLGRMGGVSLIIIITIITVFMVINMIKGIAINIISIKGWRGVNIGDIDLSISPNIFMIMVTS